MHSRFERLADLVTLSAADRDTGWRDIIRCRTILDTVTMGLERKFLFSGSLAMLLVAPLYAQTVPGTTANPAERQREIQQHIDHVTSGLLPPVVDKNDPHPGHSLNEQMNALHVPGVSIAVVHNGVIEWAEGFGVVAV